MIESQSGDVIYEKNAYEKLPMASTTKIMTAIVAIENCDLDKEVTIPPEAVGIEGSSLYLKQDDKMSMRELLFGLMLRSANDAAVAIAVNISGSVEGFADLMNTKAKELGLENTHFMNPNGLDDENHYTTAYDLARLTHYAMQNSAFAEIVSTLKYSVNGNTVVNHNKLLRIYEGCCGVKTGFTKKSGRCLVSAATREGVSLIAVTLNAPDDWNDHKAMFDMGFSEYKSVELCTAGSLTFELDCAGGKSDRIKVTNRDSVVVSLRQSSSEVSCIVETKGPSLLFSPIKKGTELADAVFYQNGRVIARVPLYANENLESKQYKKSFWDHINIFNFN